MSNDTTVAVTTKTVHTEIGASGNGASESDTGLLVGIGVISALFVLTLVSIGGFFMYRRRRQEAKNK